MGTIIGNVAVFAFVPVVIAYFGVLWYVQRSSTHRDLQRLAATLALPVFATLNTLAVVVQPRTVLTCGFSLLWLAVAALGGCWLAMGSRRRSDMGIERQYGAAAAILCLAVVVRNIVYVVI